ncbi:MAG: hypothetical protein ACFE8B_12515 [Candidatus Hermodarchaeota archaeon]
MPHFGLIDKKLPEIEQYLLRARLHIRGGKIRIEKGEISAGLAALYDAFIFALYWYFLSDEMLKPLLYNGDSAYKDEEILYLILLSYGRIDGSFDYERFLKLTVKALNTELDEIKYDSFINDFDSLMEQLQIIPYNENLLPQEQPITL